MILAAGRGTRLGALGESIPKVLVDVGGVPILERHLVQLASAGVDRVVINAHHLAENLKTFLGACETRLSVECIVEHELLGTAGGVRNALDLLGSDPFLVVYGDVLVSDPFRPLLDEHSRRKAPATLAVHEAQSSEGKGIVQVDNNRRVVSFAEKEARPEGSTVLVNSGVYVLDPAFVASLEEGAVLDFGMDVFPEAIRRGLPLFAYQLESPVIDIGTPDGLRDARRAVGAGMLEERSAT